MSHYSTVTTALDVAREHGSQRQAAEFMLEAITDRLGFAGVLELLADVAQAKADHWATNWEHDSAHNQYETLADRLSILASLSGNC